MAGNEVRVGGARVDLTGDSGRLIASTRTANAALRKHERATRQLQRQYRRFNRTAARTVKGLLSFRSAIGLVAGSSGIGLAIKSATDYGATLGDFSSQVDLSVEQLQLLRRVANSAGVGVNEFESSFVQFNRSLGQYRQAVKEGAAETNIYARLLRRVGITQDDVFDKSTIELFYQYADGFKEIGNQADRLFIAANTLGGSGTKLVGVLQNGSEAVKASAQEFERFGVVSTEVSDVLGALAQEQDNTADVFRTGWANAIAEISGELINFQQSIQTNLPQAIGAFAGFLRLLVVNVDRLLVGLKALVLIALAVVIKRWAAAFVVFATNVVNARNALAGLRLVLFGTFLPVVALAFAIEVLIRTWANLTGRTAQTESVLEIFQNELARTEGLANDTEAAIKGVRTEAELPYMSSLQVFESSIARVTKEAELAKAELDALADTSGQIYFPEGSAADQAFERLARARDELAQLTKERDEFLSSFGEEEPVGPFFESILQTLDSYLGVIRGRLEPENFELPDVKLPTIDAKDIQNLVEDVKPIEQAAENIEGAFENFTTSAITNFENIGDAAEALGQLIQEELTRALIARPIVAAVSSAIGGLFQPGATPAPTNPDPQQFLGPGPTAFAAEGGLVSGRTVVGERGPELVDFRTPARVYPADVLRDALGTRSAAQPRVVFAPVIQTNDSDAVSRALEEAFPVFSDLVRGGLVADLARPSSARSRVRARG